MEEQKRYNEKVNSKNFQKYLKKLLTNQSKYVIMNMFFGENNLKIKYAGLVEQVDIRDLKSRGGNPYRFKSDIPHHIKIIKGCYEAAKNKKE